MFSKAKVKRFNEEEKCTPGPNAYDPKKVVPKTGLALTKSQRFEETRYVTPGPGQYLLPAPLGSARKLNRSTSFRIDNKKVLYIRSHISVP